MNKTKHFWQTHNATIVLVFMLAVFFSYAIFLALNLQRNMIHDEERTLFLAKHFSTTIGVPPDVPENLLLNWMIRQNPNLFSWINGRFINIFTFIYPAISDWQLLVSLRITNVFYALGTAIFCYFLSKELIDHKWWQLLPVFLLTNTVMFVFQAGGLSSDNLTHLVNIAALYFLVRILNHRGFLVNSLAMMIFLAAGTLIKQRLLPFMFALVVVWAVYLAKNIKFIWPLRINNKKVVLLGIIMLFFILGNLGIYGYNLLVYRSVLPSCRDILSKDMCDLRLIYVKERSMMHVEAFQQGKDYSLTLSEAVELGYPGPVRYFFVDWLPILSSRLFGVAGDMLFYSEYAKYAHLLMGFWMLLVILLYFRDFSFNILSLLAILIFYTGVLLFRTYQYELTHRFINTLILGRYMFAVINIPFVFVAIVLKGLPNKLIRTSALVVLCALYFIAGPFWFFLLSYSRFTKIFLIK